MKTKLTPRLGLLLVAALMSCSPSPLRKLADRLGEADRVIVVDNVDTNLTMRITAEEQQKLVRALPAARKEKQIGLAWTPEMRIQFYKGTNLLGTLNTARTSHPKGLFATESGEYWEESGVLDAITTKFAERQATNPPPSR